MTSKTSTGSLWLSCLLSKTHLRRLSCLFLALALVFGICAPVEPAAAAVNTTGAVSTEPAAIQVTSSTAVLHFPELIHFQMEAESEESIVLATLIYGLVSDSCPAEEFRRAAELTQGKKVSGEAVWFLWESGNLPPGAEIWWKWEVRDIGGNKIITEPQTLTIEDENYTWKTLTRGDLTLYWAEGGPEFGQKILEIAAGSLDRLEEKTGMAPDQPIELRLYPSAEAMQKALLYVTDWAGGVAFPEQNVTMIGLGPSDLIWARQIIPHELSHLVSGMRAANCAGNTLPFWLEEGLAEYAKGYLPQNELDQILVELEHDRLPDLAKLLDGFPSGSEEAGQAYVQSRVMVSWLIDMYGMESLNALFDRVREGMPGEDALISVYGLNTDGIDKTWRAEQGYGEAPPVDHNTPTPTPTKTPRPTRTPKRTITPTVEPTATVTVTPTPTTAPITSTPAPEIPTMVAGRGTQASDISPVLLVLAGGALSLAVAVGIVGLVVLARRRKKR